MAKYKYLGKRVKDRGKKGLDTVSEYREIKNAILNDVKKGKITPQTARGRLLLLLRLVDRNSKFNASAKTKSKLKAEIRNAMKQISSKKRR